MKLTCHGIMPFWTSCPATTLAENSDVRRSKLSSREPQFDGKIAPAKILESTSGDTGLLLLIGLTDCCCCQKFRISYQIIFQKNEFKAMFYRIFRLFWERFFFNLIKIF